MTEAHWALVVAVVAAVAALVSAVVAVLAKRDSRTSATAAQTSAGAAEDSVAEARRANDRNDTHDLAALNEEIRLGLIIRPGGADNFRFINQSWRPVQGLRIVNPPAGLVGADQVFEVPVQGESAPFGFSGTSGERPRALMVQWEGLDELDLDDTTRRTATRPYNARERVAWSIGYGEGRAARDGHT